MISVTLSLYSGAFRMAARNPPPPAPVRLQPTYRERCTVYRAEHISEDMSIPCRNSPAFSMKNCTGLGSEPVRGKHQ